MQRFIQRRLFCVFLIFSLSSLKFLSLNAEVCMLCHGSAEENAEADVFLFAVFDTLSPI